jgi:hypothetical protein
MALDFPDSPTDGHLYEGFVFSSATGAWRVRRDPAIPLLECLVIGGGGGSGGGDANGDAPGGGGGYRCSVPGETSGGGIPAETFFGLVTGTYRITVGAGGVGHSNGSNSVLAGIVAYGGGRGGIANSSGGGENGYFGGSGGGGGWPAAGGVATGGQGEIRQGFLGGNGQHAPGSYTALGGGGGAGGAGGNNSGATSGVGGVGLVSSITGSAVERAGGGAVTTATGGGGTNGVNGTANTGGGAGSGNGFNGGSGVIIFRVATGTAVSFSGGVTQTSATVGSNTVYTVTATATTSETFTIG